MWCIHIAPTPSQTSTNVTRPQGPYVFKMSFNEFTMPQPPHKHLQKSPGPNSAPLVTLVDVCVAVGRWGIVTLVNVCERVGALWTHQMTFKKHMVVGALWLWSMFVKGLGHRELIKWHFKNIRSLGPRDFGRCSWRGRVIVNSSNDISKTYGRWGLVTLVDVCEGVGSLWTHSPRAPPGFPQTPLGSPYLRAPPNLDLWKTMFFVFGFFVFLVSSRVSGGF